MTCGVGFWTTPWLTWCGLNKYPELNLKESNCNDTHTHTHMTLVHYLSLSPARFWKGMRISAYGTCSEFRMLENIHFNMLNSLYLPDTHWENELNATLQSCSALLCIYVWNKYLIFLKIKYFEMLLHTGLINFEGYLYTHLAEEIQTMTQTAWACICSLASACICTRQPLPLWHLHSTFSLSLAHIHETNKTDIPPPDTAIVHHQDTAI